MKSAQSTSSYTANCSQKVDDYIHGIPLAMGDRNRSLESLFHTANQSKLFQGVILRKAAARSSSSSRNDPDTPLSSPLSNSEMDVTLHVRRKSRSETHLNFQAIDFGHNPDEESAHQYNEVNNSNRKDLNEKTEDILAKALKIALEKQEAYRKTESDQNSESAAEESRIHTHTTSCEELPRNSMMMSTPPPGVQTDSEGLILPKKIVNPCLESSDRKNLHRELMFNNKIGKSVLNQKSELQRVLEKKRERQIFLQQQQQEAVKIESGLKGELNRVIMERAQKLEKQTNSSIQEQEIESHVNPEYLNARAKLRARIEMK